ncbi:MAG: hypothetical protein SPE43_10640, partial [Ruminococcus sp.]|nr:hypothetical protein [Ruminococcus sp.]
MIIKLIKSAKDNVVHGTDNGKKTACRINFQNDARNFQEIGTSENILPLTCEKCRTVLAQKIINEDKKERKRLIKEEKIREKKGIVDENIISLAGRHARPMDEIPEPEPEPEPSKSAEINQTYVAENNFSASSNPAPAVSPYMNDELAQFAIPTPPPVTENEKPSEKVQNNDDFLAQFSVPKPEAEPAPAPVSKPTAPAYSDDDTDDFLSYFTMPEETYSEKNNNSAENDSEFDFLNTPTISAEEAYEESVSPDEEYNYFSKPSETVEPDENNSSDDDFLAQFTVPKPSETVEPDENNSADDDFLAQFTVPKPSETAEPVQNNSADDDFLAQFTVPKPSETVEPVQNKSDDDFLAQ